MAPPLKFGIYLAPIHPVRENPTAALHRDLELMTLLDSLGYDCAWVGEQHSAGVEIIGSPEAFIAAAAARTHRIRLGAGISSLPSQHPLLVADRIMLLDHLTRGRVELGIGPDALRTDAHMMGVDPGHRQEMTSGAIEVLLALLRGEQVTRHTRWFELVEARLQLKPFSNPSVQTTVASQGSPSGARIAGIHGLGLMTLGATTPGGFNDLGASWEIYERSAVGTGHHADRTRWSLVGPVHIAETRKQALANVRFGIADWVNYFREVVGINMVPEVTSGEGAIAEAMVDSGLAVIGTPRDAITQIKRLQAQSGGFGCFLQMAHNWADWPQTKASYELFMRYVAPEFGKSNDGRRTSYRDAARHRTRFKDRAPDGTDITMESEHRNRQSEINAPRGKE